MRQSSNFSEYRTTKALVADAMLPLVWVSMNHCHPIYPAYHSHYFPTLSSFHNNLAIVIVIQILPYQDKEKKRAILGKLIQIALSYTKSSSGVGKM